MAWEYSEKTKQLFLDAVHGKPGTHLGEIQNADGFGEHGSIACGDSLRFTFRVEKNEADPTLDKIVEARYLTFGCTSAIAASEALCVILEARACTPIEALKITNQDIVDFLEGLPDQKIHCSVMGAEALEAAVADWAAKRGVDLAGMGIHLQEQLEEEEEGRLVCKCFNITEPFLRRKIKELNLRTTAQVTAALKAGGACQNCLHAPGGIQDILDDVWASERLRVQTAQPAGGYVPAPGNAAPAAAASSAAPAAPQLVQIDGAPVSAGNETASAGTPQGFGNAGSDGGGALPIFGQPTLTPSPVTAPAASPVPAAGGSALSPYQFMKKIEEVIENMVRPVLLRDGGDCAIVDIKGNLIYVELRGACASCSSANVTLKNLVETTLRQQVQEDIRVIQV